MQLKRDTEYALRIMTFIAENVKDGAKKEGIPASSAITATGIPILTFNRICESLEEKRIIRIDNRGERDKWLQPGKNFWEQSILTVGKAIEGNMEIFAVFDRNTYFTQLYGNKLKETQKSIDQILSKTTLKELVISKD